MITSRKLRRWWGEFKELNCSRICNPVSYTCLHVNGPNQYSRFNLTPNQSTSLLDLIFTLYAHPFPYRWIMYQLDRGLPLPIPPVPQQSNLYPNGKRGYNYEMAGSHVASSAHIPFHWISTLNVVHKAMINVTHPWEGTIRWLWSIAYCNQNKPNPTIFTATKKLEKAKKKLGSQTLKTYKLLLKFSL